MLSDALTKRPFSGDIRHVAGALLKNRIGAKPSAEPGRFPEPFRENRCLFINIPGCEGCTIHASLFGRWNPGHVPLRWYERQFPKEYAASFKFAFVRDPVDRVYVAWARWMEARLFVTAECGEGVDLEEGFDGFVDRWMHEEHIHDHADFAPQADFLTDKQNRLTLDFIGRYETLERDFGSLRDFLCIPATLPWSAPAYERTPGARYAVSAWARRRIRQVYARDYELLGYD
ncbi:sulfotransferase family protein [Pseudomonas sp. RIT-PI-S]|uniref:sulfotransferase family protein n=1 Tax=Pseudomonas sp. RIT-PI-S TaxID=3035295 RepID=UPI0021D9BF97|nr:sulfotransferase family protein [Pseudomonas sp. RIT-PI-S]